MYFNYFLGRVLHIKCLSAAWVFKVENPKRVEAQDNIAPNTVMNSCNKSVLHATTIYPCSEIFLLWVPVCWSKEVIRKHIHAALYSWHTVVFRLSILVSGGGCGRFGSMLSLVDLVHQLATLNEITRVVSRVVLQSRCPSRASKYDICKQNSWCCNLRLHTGTCQHRTTNRRHHWWCAKVVWSKLAKRSAIDKHCAVVEADVLNQFLSQIYGCIMRSLVLQKGIHHVTATCFKNHTVVAHAYVTFTWEGRNCKARYSGSMSSVR